MHPRTQIVGLCDLIQERLGTLGDELGVAARYDDLDAMIVETEPDIVAIPTGTEFHYELSMRVLEHGVNIEVEKPICVDLEQADEVLAKASKKGARVAVHHQSRSGGSMRVVAQAVEDGRIGELRQVNASGKGYYGGYGLMNIGTHSLNSMMKLTGRCRRVFATAITGGRPITPDGVVPSPSGMGTIAGESISAHLEFDEGVTGTLLQHRMPLVDATGHALEILGSDGRIILNVSRGAWLLDRAWFLPDGEYDTWQALEAEVPGGYDPEGKANLDDYWFVEEYVRALDEGRAHESSGDEARHVMEIMMGIFESAAYGRAVELPQAKRDHPLLRWRRENGLGDPEPMPRPYYEWLEAEDRRLGRL
jgi:predicted dehydrogenase